MTKIKKVLFVGSKELGLKCLGTICALDRKSLIGAITIDDRSDTRTVYPEFVKFCQNEKIKLFTVKNKKNFNEVIRDFKPELCIVVGWYWLIDADILRIIPHGSIGIHGSLLPKYRGASPLVWAIINRENFTGVSMFSFEEGMDNGDIWGQKRILIKKNDYIGDLLGKVEVASVKLLNEKYLKILNRELTAKKQNHQNATYCAQRIPEDGLIDWGKSAQEIYDFIRAQSAPYPGAFTFLGERKMIVWRARPLKTTFYGTPGQVAKISPEGVFIICGDQKPIVLEEVQLTSEAKINPSEIIKSIKIRLK